MIELQKDMVVYRVDGKAIGGDTYTAKVKSVVSGEVKFHGVDIVYGLVYAKVLFKETEPMNNSQWIKAWADGVPLEMRTNMAEEWALCIDMPRKDTYMEYRVKVCSNERYDEVQDYIADVQEQLKRIRY